MESESPAQTSQPYSDLSLDISKKEIRLLDLLPAPHINNEIYVTLSKASLDDAALKYDALSYTWGPSTEHHTIRLHGQGEHPVTDNLYYALRRIRHRRVEKRIWIDAICINQEDIRERSQQVTLMGDIYSKAECVLVWLGESEKGIIEGSNGLGDVKVPLSGLFSQANPIMFKHRIKHLLATIRNTTPLWWNRAWVVQEAACASKVTVRFGPCSISLYWFETLLMGIRDDCNFENETSEKLFLTATNAIDGIRTIGKSRLRNRESIAKSMWSSRHTAATNPLDKVYSLLALMPENTTDVIKPDYNDSMVETFAKATYAAIALDGNLDIMGWIKLPADGPSNQEQTLKQNPELPSWSVDLLDIDYSLFDVRVRDFLLNIWANTSTSSQDAKYLSNGRLSLTGHSLDRIRFVTLFPEAASQPSAREQEALCAFFAQATRLSQEHNPKPLFDAKYKEQKTIRPQTTWEDWYRSKLDERWERERLDLDYLGECFLLWEQAVGFEKTVIGRNGLSGKWDWYHHLKRYGEIMSGGASLFMTQCGMPGVAPAVVREGDQIVILDGARLPIVLSPHAEGNDWVFRGFVYVHGCMASERDGSVWSLRRLKNDGSTRRMRFVLR